MDSKKKALLAVIGGNSIFGFSFIFSKMALLKTIPSVLIAIRFLIAFFVLNLVVLVGKNIKRKDETGVERPLLDFSLRGKPVRDIVILSLFQPVLYFICENYGIVYTSSSFAGTIIAVIPVAGVMFDVMLMHSKVSMKQILCAVFSAVGVAITTVGAEGMKSSFIGLLLLLGAVAGGSLFYVYSKKSGEHFSAIERTYVMFLIGSVFYVVLALVQAHGAYGRLIFEPLADSGFIISVLYLSVFSSVFAFLLLNYGASGVSVSEGAMFANLSTVISIAAGVIFLGESFNLFQVMGAAVILVSVYIASTGSAGEAS